MTTTGQRNFGELLQDVSWPTEPARCCDLTGQDPETLIWLNRRFGTKIALVGLPRAGSLDKLDVSGWPQEVAALLRARGVAEDAVTVITRRDQLEPADIILAAGGPAGRFRTLGESLEVLALPGSLLLTDVRQGSGGFAFLRRYGKADVLDKTAVDDKAVRRIALHMTGSAKPAAADPGWADIAADLVGPEGFYRENGTHSFTFIPRSDVLCVTFDNLDIAMNNRADRRPWGYGFIEKQGWSMLGVMAEGWTWYRDPWVFDEFDRLRDSGFFRRFRHVIFYGASMGGYAALSFSSACPGAQVVAFSPQTTLDKRIVPWESRYKAAWGYDYSGRYGDAADMTAPAHRVSLFYDPYMPLDKGHINRLAGDNLVHLRCPFMGHRLGSMLQQMGVLQPLVLSAMRSELSPQDLALRLRARRGFRRYRMELLQKAVEKGHRALAARLCRYALREGDDGFFRKTLKELGD